MDPAHLSLGERSARHAALGDPIRLSIIDELTTSDRAPVELRRRLGIESNLLAHHLDVLESVGLVTRSRSNGDRRRRYVHLCREALVGLAPGGGITPAPALFVCSANSARSQLAAALWHRHTGQPAVSAGTHPGPRVHAGALAAAKRAGLDLSGATPRELGRLSDPPDLVVTVCDQAHEELAPADDWLHWSIPDPVPLGTKAAFDDTVAELTRRITALASATSATSTTALTSTNGGRDS